MLGFVIYLVKIHSGMLFNMTWQTKVGDIMGADSDWALQWADIVIFLSMHFVLVRLWVYECDDDLLCYIHDTTIEAFTTMIDI